MRRRSLFVLPLAAVAVVVTAQAADAGLPSTATQVAVSSGNTASGIDGHLAEAASIAGTVTSSTGTPLSGTVFGYRSGHLVASTLATNGAYVLNGLTAGSYAVCMGGANVYAPLTATGFVGRCFKTAAFNGTSVPSNATLVSVSTAPATHRTGINLKLPAGAAVSGKVTSPSGAGLANPFVTAYNRSTKATFFGFGATNGTYSVKGLTASATGYTVCMRVLVNTGTGYLPRCYKNKPWNGNGTTSSTATAVSVSLGHVHTGINQSLPRAGAISGRVVDAATGKPVASDSVAVMLSGRWVGGASTDTHGNYVVRGLFASTSYRVCAAPTNVSPTVRYQGQCWKNRAWNGGALPSGTTAVGVKLASTHTGINFKVGKTVIKLGSIAGTVTEKAHLQPVSGASVSAFTSAGGFAGSAQTDASGHYKIGGLHASSTGYVICVTADFASSTTAPPPTGWAPRCHVDAAWNGTAVPSLAKRLPLTAGQNRTGVDVSLPIGGAIAGTTFQGNTATPALGVTVKVFTPGGRQVASTFSSFGDGTYTVTGLAAPAKYVVCFDGRSAGFGGGTAYLPQCYDKVAWSG